MKNKLIQEIIIALSMANLLFIKSWRSLLYPTSEPYHIKLEPQSLDYLGIMICVLITAGLFFFGLQILRSILKDKTSLIANWALLGVFLIILNGIRQQFFQSESTTSLYLKFGVLALCIVIGVIALVKWKQMIFPFLRSIFLFISPFVLITFSQATLGAFSATQQSDTSISSQLSSIKKQEKTSIKSRVVWIVFDELDYFLPFELSPSIVDLPEFTKLKNESFFATQATPPSTATRESMSSLITGKKVKEGIPNGKSELMLNFEDETNAKFSEAPNIFRKVREINGETAAVGWYHPYCRVIGKDLSACHWESFDTFNDFDKQSLPQIISKNFLQTLISLPFGFRLFQMINSKSAIKAEDTSYVRRHYRLINATKESVANNNIDLVLIHLPLPHQPNKFNRKTNKFGLNSTTYFDNLVLTDNVLGKIRQTLEEKDLWKNSTILVSSDHHWRINEYIKKGWLSKKDLQITKGKEDTRIPFILKLKNQKEAFVYNKPFNTLITHDLILAIIKGEISTPTEIETWLNNNSK